MSGRVTRRLAYSFARMNEADRTAMVGFRSMRHEQTTPVGLSWASWEAQAVRAGKKEAGSSSQAIRRSKMAERCHTA